MTGTSTPISTGRLIWHSIGAGLAMAIGGLIYFGVKWFVLGIPSSYEPTDTVITASITAAWGFWHGVRWRELP